MKIRIVGLIVLLALGALGVALAEMDGMDYSFNVVGVQTNSQAYVCRGEICAISITTPGATSTGKVTLVSDEAIIYSNAALSTAYGAYVIRVPSYTTAGAAATVDAYTGSTGVAQTVWSYLPVAGKVTLKVIGVNGTTSTNAYKARVLFK